MRGAVAIAIGSILCITSPAAAYDVVVMQGLDKVTARISTFEIEVGTPGQFGTLEIQARVCEKRPPEEPPESAAFLEIAEKKPESEPEALFSGWMFASSPALSALEHPVYDVWVIDCKDTNAAATNDAASEGTAQ